jgi:hypothetical protein
MEAELRQESAAAPARIDSAMAWREVVFSVREARRALPYVARIAADAADAFRRVRVSRQGLEAAAARERRRILCELPHPARPRLDCAIDDCNAVGAHLVDIPEGVVSLPAQINGRAVSLLWRLGESIHAPWHDLGELAAVC